MRDGEGHHPGPTSVTVSCRMPSEQAQRMFEQADAAGSSHSDYLRALISDGVAAAATAVEAARQETAHAYQTVMNQKVELVRVEMNQTVEALRAELAEARKASEAWMHRAEELEQHIVSSSFNLMTAVESVLLGGSAYQPSVLHWLARVPPDDPLRILPAIAVRLVEWLKEISDETSSRRVDINRDRKKLKLAEWLVRTISSEIRFSEARNARQTATWQAAAEALEAAKKALEKRQELAGENR